jgi:DNA-binding NarL/FixJ family response regulator
MHVVASCGDLPSLLAAVETERPDVVVTDIRMPPTSTDEGIRLAAVLRDDHPEIGVVVLSNDAEPAYAISLLESGPERRAYLLKERIHDRAQLVAAIESVAAAGSMLDAKIVEALVAPKLRVKRSALAVLTARERSPRSPRARTTPRSPRASSSPSARSRSTSTRSSSSSTSPTRRMSASG